MVRVLVLGLTASAIALAAEASPSSVTFDKDVVPILERNCQSCHRPGQVAPMSLLTYKDARPWAKAIKTAVLTKKMPPWSADPNYGHFLNDRTLKKSDLDTISAWVDSGSPEGDAKDAPPPVQWPAGGWLVQPDIVLDGPEFDVPASGVIDWMWVPIPGNFTKDTWVTSIQFQPLDPAVVHHVGLAFAPHTPDVKYYEPQWDRVLRDARLITIPGQKYGGPSVVGRFALGGREQDTYLPGHTISDYRSFNAARLIPANTDIYLNLHYTPNGTPVRTHVRVGFTVAKEPPQKRFVMAPVAGPTDRENFRIPANDPDWGPTPAEVTFARDAEIVSMMPHMHVRGKSMKFTLTYPDGKSETLLNVPNYDFNWQLEYDVSPIKVPKGSKLTVDAHFDNSPNNKFNPDPTHDVFYGEQTWEEMMTGYVGVIVSDTSIDPRQLFEKKARTTQQAAK